jgi:hypothetical protein
VLRITDCVADFIYTHRMFAEVLLSQQMTKQGTAKGG